MSVSNYCQKATDFAGRATDFAGRATDFAGRATDFAGRATDFTQSDKQVGHGQRFRYVLWLGPPMHWYTI